MILSPEARVRFIAGNTSLVAPPHVPEIRLHLAHESHALWLKTEDELQQIGLPPPYWAFAWAGGQALARHVLDHSEIVRGRTVLDFASGSGIVGIAAVMAGAARVLCADIDAFSDTAIRMNAAENGVTVDVTLSDLTDGDIGEEVVLAGDVFYEQPMSDRLAAWFSRLRHAGRTVLVGDPGRAYMPRDRLSRLSTYEVVVSRDLEDSEIKRTTVWAFDR